MSTQTKLYVLLSFITKYARLVVREMFINIDCSKVHIKKEHEKLKRKKFIDEKSIQCR